GGGPRRGHGLKGLALVAEVALGGLHQVRYQVETPLQLDVDLGEGILVSIACHHEAVVDPDREKCDSDHNSEQNQHRAHRTSPYSCKGWSRRYDRPAGAAYAGAKPDERHSTLAYPPTRPDGDVAPAGCRQHRAERARAPAGRAP